MTRTAARLNAQLDLDAVLNAVCEETARALNVPAVSVLLHEPEQEAFVLAATVGLPPEVREHFSPVPRSRYDEYARQAGLLIVVPDLQAALDLTNAEFYAQHNMRTVVAASLIREDELIGTLNLHSLGEPRAFDDDELALLEGLANQAAQAITNARLYASVAEQGERLRLVAVRLAEVEEAERQRLARELHDQVGQNLAALGINLNIMRNHLPPLPPKSGGEGGRGDEGVRSRLDDSLALVEQTTERVRSVMAELRPPALDDYGLAAALRWYGAQFSARTGTAVDVRGEDLVPRLAAPVENALFRIAQEALTNVAKHAQARQVTITVEPEGGIVRLVIADDGLGFDPARLAGMGGPQRWGLMTMAERAIAVGGQCRIESEPGQGTHVVVEVPQ